MNAAIRCAALVLVYMYRPWFKELRELIGELRATTTPTLSKNLTMALIAAEDHRFYRHQFGAYNLQTIVSLDTELKLENALVANRYSAAATERIVIQGGRYKTDTCFGYVVLSIARLFNTA